MGDGSNPSQGFLGKVLSAGTRLITGESLFLTHFTNQRPGKQHIAFSAPYPGTIVPLDLKKINGEIIVQKDGFLCAALGTKLTIHFNKRLGSGVFGGEGFILQRIQGDGQIFIHAGGTVIERDLKNETLKVDTGCVVAFEPSIDFNIESVGSLKSMVFGGEGLFLATLSGTGKVWLQSMPVKKLIQALAPSGRNRSKEDNSFLGNFLER